MVGKIAGKPLYTYKLLFSVNDEIRKIRVMENMHRM
jgi:hypothetical protein